MKLEGKVALVTGSSRGIGRAIALHLATLGADVVVNARNLHAAKEYGEELTADTVMDEVKALGRRSIGVEADVTNKDAVNAMFKRIVDEFGHIDILVNNAGGGRGKRGYVSGGSAGVAEEDVRAIIDQNLMSTIFCCQAAIPPMIARKSGTIVNMGSRAGLSVIFSGAGSSYAQTAYYGTAKAAIMHYTRLLAAELGPHGIRVNSIAPGLTLTTEVAARIRKGLSDPTATLKDVPLGRLGEVKDIANAVEFLCTDASAYITGQCIRVDGGRALF